MKPATKEAYDLFHNGAITLARIEQTGMRIDTKYLDWAMSSTDQKIKDIEAELKDDKTWKLWKREYGNKTKFGSDVQLAHILFSVLDYPCTSWTNEDRTRPSMDEEVLQSIDLPFVHGYLRHRKLSKALNTFLKGIKTEVVDGFLHPMFNLHIARTYRSSSDTPNFHNLPIRDPEFGELIRRCFIPRKGRRIIETDYKGIEVRVAACYNHDPVLISYIKDQTKDMHRDMAAQCYMVHIGEVTKAMRYCGKNMFVFPEFYGDAYFHCAVALWEAIHKMDMRGPGGISLYEHLANKGITKLGACNPKQKPVKGTFEYHIHTVERDFWDNRFKVYTSWKRKWYEQYLKNGGFMMFTGFKEEGILSRNDVINHPVQGSAFHCLLWSLIEIDEIMRKERMESCLIGQIHDSIEGDILESEEKEYVGIVEEVMCNKIRKHWDWITVPLEVEIEASKVDGNWFEKEAMAV